ACLSAGIVTVPAYPPRRNRNADRLWSILDDARPRLLLTTRQTLPLLETGDLASGKAVPCLRTDDPGLTGDEAREHLVVAGDTVACLQYTSGSTGTPRGVIITHGNIVANEQIIQQRFGHRPWSSTHPTTGVSWLPLFHDMGLIGGLLQPLYVGFP